MGGIIPPYHNGVIMIFNHLYYIVIRKEILPNSIIEEDYRIEPDSNLLIQKVFSKHDYEYELKFYDGIRLWSNNFVKITNFAGTPEFPSKFLKEFILRKNTILHYQFKNLSSNTQTIELVFQCQKIDKEPTEPFKYRQFVENINLPPYSKISKIIEFDNANKFYVQKLLAYNSEPDESVVIENFEMSSLYSRSLISAPISLQNMFGRALRPNLIPELTIEPYSTSTISIKNNSNKNIELQLCFDGYELL